MMKNALGLLSFILLASCSGSPICECVIRTSDGSVTLSCGQSSCVDGTGWVCNAAGQASMHDEACTAALTSCVPTTCEAEKADCGTISNGCGGTTFCGSCAAGLKCNNVNVCESPCSQIQCDQGLRCDPAVGQCIPDPCVVAGKVCGSLQSFDCGSCPGDMTCASTQRACIEKIATLPFAEYTLEATLAKGLLYVSGPPSKGANISNLVELSLATKTMRTVAVELQRLSDLSFNGTDLYFATTTGLNKLAPGTLQIQPIPAFKWGCHSLLATADRVLCGIGGNPKLGVEWFGIETVPLKGGSAESLVGFLNYPYMSLYGDMLFYVGTTDNFGSWASLSMYYLPSGYSQELVSGGILSSSFVLNDAQAYYFVREDAAGNVLVRTGYTASQGTDLFMSDGFSMSTTLSTNKHIYTVARGKLNSGLYRVPTNTVEKPIAILAAKEAGADVTNASWLLKTENGFILVVGVDVFRIVIP